MHFTKNTFYSLHPIFKKKKNFFLLEPIRKTENSFYIYNGREID